MARQPKLVLVPVPYSIDRALGSAPEFKTSHQPNLLMSPNRAPMNRTQRSEDCFVACAKTFQGRFWPDLNLNQFNGLGRGAMELLHCSNVVSVHQPARFRP